MPRKYPPIKGKEFRSLYKEPRSPENPGKFFEIPPINLVLDHIQEFGGDIDEFLKDIDSKANFHKQILFEIYRRLNEDKEARKRWREMQKIWQRVRNEIVEHQALKDAIDFKNFQAVKFILERRDARYARGVADNEGDEEEQDEIESENEAMAAEPDAAEVEDDGQS